MIDPTTGKEFTVEGVVECVVEMGPKMMVSAQITVRPKAVQVEVRADHTHWSFDCPACSEHVDHECRPPDFATPLTRIMEATKEHK